MKVSRFIFQFVVLYTCVAACFPGPCFGSNIPDTTDYYNAGYIQNSNHIHDPLIRSVVLYKQGFELADPVLVTGSGDRLDVSFDDLRGGFRQYYFTAVHCDAGWNTTDIWQNEYLTGYFEDLVESFEPSFNTFQPYTHYKFNFPNDRIGLKLSGNYVLQVYELLPDGTHDIKFTRRFMAADPKVSIEAKVSRAPGAEDFDTGQELSVRVYTNGYRIDSPYQDLVMAVLQNNRWDNANTRLKPFMVLGDELDYTHRDGSNNFDGGNEFRHFDIKSLRSISEQVRSIRMTDSGYLVNLWEREKRTFKVYQKEGDIDGKFLLKSDDETNSETMGEYARVCFFLPCDAPVVHGSLYVAGGFNGWDYTPENKMYYNFRKRGYECSLYLKQGYYNYMYTLLPDRSGAGDVTFIEGNHSETENTYTILLYHRERGSLYDQLIGIATVDPGGTK